MITFKQYLLESKEKDLLLKMNEFGMSGDDIDFNGYVTLYHGGKILPKIIKPESKGGIFFLTNSYDTAKDYADMRQGKVFEIKVKPQDVNWNTGSNEIEIQDGGKIVNGIFYPKNKSEDVFLPKEKEYDYNITLPETTSNDAKKGDYVVAISGIGYFGTNPLKVTKNTGNGLKLEGKSGVFSYGQFELVK